MEKLDGRKTSRRYRRSTREALLTRAGASLAYLAWKEKKVGWKAMSELAQFFIVLGENPDGHVVYLGDERPLRTVVHPNTHTTFAPPRRTLTIENIFKSAA